MALTEQEIFELQDVYKRIFYRRFNPADYRFLGTNFITKESEPVILTGCSHRNYGTTNDHFFCIANTNGIIQICDSFDDAKREIGI